jgi:hypothetical protein
MTRKDYVAIAAALARTRPDPQVSPDGQNTFFDGIKGRQWAVTRDAIIGALQADNPRFDRVRFVRATEADRG